MRNKVKLLATTKMDIAPPLSATSSSKASTPSMNFDSGARDRDFFSSRLGDSYDGRPLSEVKGDKSREFMPLQAFERRGDLIFAEHRQCKHALAVAAATAAAAGAAAAAAKAAAQVVRLTCTGPSSSAIFRTSSREKWAAIKIQAAYRGHLGRQAFRALKGLVKLQAVVRGHIVRVQARLTIRCMQALVRFQERTRARQAHPLLERQASEEQYLLTQPIPEIDSASESFKVGSMTYAPLQERSDNCGRCIQRKKNNAAVKSQRPLKHYQSHQIARRQTPTNMSFNDSEPDNFPHDWSWLEGWMSSQLWASCNFEKDGFKSPTSSRSTENSGVKNIEVDGAARPKNRDK